MRSSAPIDLGQLRGDAIALGGDLSTLGFAALALLSYLKPINKERAGTPLRLLILGRDRVNGSPTRIRKSAFTRCVLSSD